MSATYAAIIRFTDLQGKSVGTASPPINGPLQSH